MELILILTTKDSKIEFC